MESQTSTSFVTPTLFQNGIGLWKNAMRQANPHICRERLEILLYRFCIGDYMPCDCVFVLVGVYAQLHRERRTT